jgi:PAS domain S-box-containing protein/putative nucleotidyltransferase with HDIG domain
VGVREQDSPAPEKVNILLVDDRPENLAAVQATLESLGQNLVTATSGREALKRLREDEFAAIVLDVAMPEMNGLETAALIRKRDKLRHLPILFLTATYASEADTFRGYAAGAVDYLVKPSPPEILRSKVAVFVDLFKARKALQRQLEETARLNWELERSKAMLTYLNETLEDQVVKRTLALKDSEERYRLLFDSNQQPLWVWDVETLAFHTVNNAAVRHYGYSREEFLSMTVKDIRPPEDVPALLNTLSQLAPGSTNSAIWRHRKKDGTIIWVEVTSHELLWGGRRARLALAHDITERKQAEESLVRMRSQLELILNSAWEGILGLDQNGVQTFVNPSAARLLGYEVDELLGLASHSIWHHTKPDGSPFTKEACPILDALRSGSVCHKTDAIFWRKNGTPLPVEYTVTPFRDGETGGAVLSFWDITERKRAEEELQISLEKLKRSLGETTTALASAVEKRDPYTSGHQQRVAQIACAIAQEIGLPQEQVEGIRVAGILHDIGKIYVPSEILSKPSRLGELEFEMVKTHSQVGYEILQGINFPWPVAQIVLQHHERMDGSGYPAGLSGEDIIPEARILAVADVVEAMASHRPYRPALGIDQALEEISQNSGTLYDPQVVEGCVRLIAEKGFQFE